MFVPEVQLQQTSLSLHLVNRTAKLFDFNPSKDPIRLEMSEKVGEKRKMVGFDAFMAARTNPMSDLFDIHKFDHLEFYCSDATQASRRFSWGLGLPLVGKSDVTTGNTHFSSQVLKNNDITFIFTAPYCDDSLDAETKSGEVPIFKDFSQDLAHNFVRKHGLAVRAVGIRVKDATEAFTLSTAAGAVAVTTPYTTTDKVSGKSMTMSEIKLFGDSVIRWVSGDFDGKLSLLLSLSLCYHWYHTYDYDDTDPNTSIFSVSFYLYTYHLPSHSHSYSLTVYIFIFLSQVLACPTTPLSRC